MRILVMLVALGLAGCAQKLNGPNLSTIMQTCGYGEKPFTASWPCVRQSFAGIKGPGDLKEVYVTSGDFVAEQVAAGKMTDAEAKLAMAQIRQRLNDADEARGRISAGDAIVLSSILNRPTGVQTAPAPVVQSVPTNCYRVGSSLQCY